jgi:hypothetical protein
MLSPILRSATTDDIPAMARVHVDSWRTTYSGISLGLVSIGVVAMLKKRRIASKNQLFYRN